MVSLTVCGLIAAVSVGASVAYLTDSQTVTNTFTFGKVQVELTEPGYTPDDHTPRVPNEEIPKDPTVANTGSNDEIVFVRFDIPMAKVKLADANGTVQENESPQELFEFRADRGTYCSVNNGWVQIQAQEVDEDDDGTADYMSYIYGYEDVVKAKAGTESATDVPPVFNFIRLANVVEGQLEEEKMHVPVSAYAIQADFLQNTDHTDLNDNIVVGNKMTIETLTQIYGIFAVQSHR